MRSVMRRLWHHRGKALAVALCLGCVAAVWWAMPVQPRFSLDRCDLINVCDDGRTIVTARHRYEKPPGQPSITFTSGPVEVWDTATGERIAGCLDERTWVQEPWASPDGR